MKIVVLTGGLSPEHDVSLSSAALIGNALIENGHEVLLMDLYTGQTPDIVYTEDGSHIEKNLIFLKKTDNTYFKYDVPETAPDAYNDLMKLKNTQASIADNVIKICQFADVTFLALHGSVGENGQLQAVFDTSGIRYTGSGYMGCLLAMNKDISKKLVKSAGLLTPDWEIITANTLTGPGLNAHIPCVVKPCNGGSSIGVSIINSDEQVLPAIRNAFKYDDTLLLEKFTEGREFSVGILNGRALPAIEIIPKNGFYDYRNKYQSGLTNEICPALISPSLEKTLADTALKIHYLLQMGFYSRIDFIVDKAENIYFIEANTLPGMTPESLLPKEAAAAGISYRALCEEIVTAAGL